MMVDHDRNKENDQAEQGQVKERACRIENREEKSEELKRTTDEVLRDEFTKL